MTSDQSNPGLTFLLTHIEQSWAEQLPRYLEPQGVRALVSTNVMDAMNMVRREEIHAAVVDLSMPMTEGDAPFPKGGLDRTPGAFKLVTALNRLEPAPPTVVVRDKFFDRRTDDRLLYEAMKLNAFTVLDKPVTLEQALQTLYRILERFYDGGMPGGCEPTDN